MHTEMRDSKRPMPEKTSPRFDNFLWPQSCWLMSLEGVAALDSPMKGFHDHRLW